MNAAVNQLVEVANKQTAIIEYKSMPVVLTEQLADLYGTEPVRIRQNYDRNNEKFIAGRHFYKVEGKELKELKESLSSLKILSPNTRSIMLWTERGAARHAKILDTEQAWEVFEQLEDCYFNMKEASKGSSVSELISLPNFFDPAEAARAWADQYEAKQVAFKERDHAIATKAEISDKKTATAMATASVKSRQAEKLKEQIGESKNYASVKAVEKVAGGQYNWRELKKWCLAHGKKIKDIADANYGSVKIYHKDAWKAVYGINLTDYFAT
ncbi:ORF6N domain-containing protein [Acinetobacter baumannii]|nr:ORF6N domain-containing protein [Acinetobacter baumannii]